MVTRRREPIAYTTLTHDDYVMRDDLDDPLRGPVDLRVTRDELSKIIMALELRAAFWETEARHGQTGAATVAVQYRDLAARLALVLKGTGPN